MTFRDKTSDDHDDTHHEQGTFVNCGHLKKFLLLPELKNW